MKYLRRYNESKIIRDVEVRLDIQDILLELDDYAIQYDIKDRNYYKDGINPHTCFQVNMKGGKGGFFRLEDIMDVLLRLEEYLKMTKFSIDVSIPDTEDYYPLDLFIDEYRGEELTRLNLYIWRGFGLTW
jgi:hypothetical protein